MSRTQLPQDLITLDEKTLLDNEAAPALRAAVVDTKTLGDHSRAESTLRRYAQDWAHFESWCQKVSPAAPEVIQTLPTNDQTLSVYVGGHQDDTPRTMMRRLSAIRYVHLRNGHISPFESAPAFSTVFDGYKRRWAGYKESPPDALVEDHLDAMLAAIDIDTLTGVRNRALLLVAYDGAFRRSEAVSIDVEDLTIEEEGITVRLRTSKANQYGESIEEVALLAQPDSPRCPVAAVNEWLTLASIDAGPVFRSMKRSGGQYYPTERRLSDKGLYRLVKELASKAELDGNYSGHSLRSGLIQNALDRGINIETIQRHVRHASIKTTAGYSQRKNKFKEHPNRIQLT